MKCNNTSLQYSMIGTTRQENMLQDPGPDAAHDGAVLLSYLRQLMPPSTSQQMLHLIKVCLTAHATIPDLTNLLETWKACNCCHPVASSAANAQEHGSNHAQQPSSAKLPPSKAQQRRVDTRLECD